MADVLVADWPAPANVRALTTLRGADLASLRKTLSLPSEPRWLRQVHGTAVAIDPGEDMPEADASVGSSPGVVLAIRTADCLPVLFCSDAGDEIAAAHAGWRGMAAGVLEATVAAMRSPPERLLAWFGPAAGPGAYEVGADVFAAFVERDSRSTVAFEPTRPGHWRVDLYSLARQRLAAVGVARVSGGDLCTMSDPARFHSHRRDHDGARMASLVWRRD